MAKRFQTAGVRQAEQRSQQLAQQYNGPTGVRQSESIQKWGGMVIMPLYQFDAQPSYVLRAHRRYRLSVGGITQQ